MTPTTKDLVIMYYEIRRLREDEHYSLRRISKYLGLNFRTVKKYLTMSREEFDGFLDQKSTRSFLLDPYRDYMISYLGQYPDTPCSVMHDKLKEYFLGFPEVHPKTVYNYVMKLRSDYGITKSQPCGRQYSPVADVQPGEQAQVDFGQKKLRTGTGDMVTVYFFSMLLCFSRYKFIDFRQSPFTASSAVEAHEKAFFFFGGMPGEIVYDQDCVFLTDENKGDYRMTDVFERYQSCRPFKVIFCRAADPESKGKIENVVKYVKQNFLYNRQFVDIDLLNHQALEWLNRTGNKMVHNTTRKIPLRQWEHEKRFLHAWHSLHNGHREKGYKLLKTNSVKYRGNSYSLPFGSYRGEDSKVYLSESEGSLIIRDAGGEILATHLIPEGTGNNIINTNHRRNTSIRLNDLRERVRDFFGDSSAIREFVGTTERLYPRYVRDQLTVLLCSSEKAGLEKAEITLEFCLRNHITSANDFKAIIERDNDKKTLPALPDIRPLGGSATRLMVNLEPEKSGIDLYETIFTMNPAN